ncbi:hypothetical protein [Specibacter cremeus]|uniref:hypothetical protein n=1 Tax=Specibacter cremeus TaxID=1629051 RepID=UPI000F78488F|nr:hypothetical protein [Specibacter cremeus]
MHFRVLVLARVCLESLIATIRTADNTRELVRLQGGAAGPYLSDGAASVPPSNPYQPSQP